MKSSRVKICQERLNESGEQPTPGGHMSPTKLGDPCQKLKIKIDPVNLDQLLLYR